MSHLHRSLDEALPQTGSAQKDPPIRRVRGKDSSVAVFPTAEASIPQDT